MKKYADQHPKKVAPTNPLASLKYRDRVSKNKANSPQVSGKTSNLSNNDKALPPQSKKCKTEKSEYNIKTNLRTDSNLYHDRKRNQFSGKTHPIQNPPTGNINVTLFSTESSIKDISMSAKKRVTELRTRDRTCTRTLKPEEATTLKNIPQITDECCQKQTMSPSIAFDVEVHFEDNPVLKLSAKNNIPINVDKFKTEESHYESDFESYESDFESDLSKKSHSSSTTSNKSSSSDLTPQSCDNEESPNSDEEDQHARIKYEQKLDSGNYDTNIQQKLMTNESCIPFGKLSNHYEAQSDSGMNSGMFESTPSPNDLKNLHKRYVDILEKISFNTMSFELYEDKPASYEYFVKNYGMMKGKQIQTQTEHHSISCGNQTEHIQRISCWIQHPPQFSMDCIRNMNAEPDQYASEKIGVGQKLFHYGGIVSNKETIFSILLKKLDNSKIRNISKVNQTNKTKCNFGYLSRFLKKCLIVLENILTKNIRNCDESESELLQLNFQNVNSTVTAANYVGNDQLFLTFRECSTETIYHKYTICVWDTKNFVRLKAVLSCWSNVLCTERIGRNIIAGTSDGTLCLWDTTEHIRNISPFQVVCPTINTMKQCHYGPVVAVRSIYSKRSWSNHTTVLSLFESGVLVSWSLSRINKGIFTDNHLKTTFFHANSMLIQQNILDLISIRHWRSTPIRSIESNFLKGNHEYSISFKCNTANNRHEDEHKLFNDMLIHHNSVILFANNQIMIVNYFDHKITHILEIQDFITNFKEHPIYKDCIFMQTSCNTIKVINIKKISNMTSIHAITRTNDEKQLTSYSNKKSSPIFSNKSCTIQNIVKNERKLYNGASSHVDVLVNTLSDNVDKYVLNDHKTQKSVERVPFHHNQIFFLDTPSHTNSRIHFLRQGQLLCVGANKNANFVDLKTGQECHFNEYMEIDCSIYRLLTTTDTQMIITTDGRTIYLYKI